MRICDGGFIYPESIDVDTMAWVGRRQRHFDCTVRTLLDFTPLRDNEEALRLASDYRDSLVRAQSDCFLRPPIEE